MNRCGAPVQAHREGVAAGSSEVLEMQPDNRIVAVVLLGSLVAGAAFGAIFEHAAEGVALGAGIALVLVALTRR